MRLAHRFPTVPAFLAISLEDVMHSFIPRVLLAWRELVLFCSQPVHPQSTAVTPNTMP